MSSPPLSESSPSLGASSTPLGASSPPHVVDSNPGHISRPICTPLFLILSSYCILAPTQSHRMLSPCIAYLVHAWPQITFSPTLMYRSKPTSMMFLERGRAVLPETALVRVLKGSVPGCVGVWDGSAAIAAEATLHRKGRQRIRPEGWPVTNSESEGAQMLRHSAPLHGIRAHNAP